MNPNDIKIDPAFIDLKKALRESVEAYLDRLPEQEKRDRGLLPFVPSIPEDEQGVNDYIEGIIDPYQPGTYSQEELREQLIENIENLGLNIDTSLPTDQLREAIKNSLVSMDNEEKLRIGVFGKATTEEQLQQFKEWQIDHFINQINEVAYGVAPQEIADALQTIDVERIREGQLQTAKDFKKDIELIQSHLKARHKLN